MSAASRFVRAVRAEAFKEMRGHWGRGTNLALEAVVPGIHFAMAWYMFAPFGGEGRDSFLPSAGDDALLLFLLVGFLGYYAFQRLMWAAMERTYREREGGTLELLMLTPAHRMGLLVGGAFGGLIRATWMYAAFLAGCVAFAGGWHVAHAGSVLVALAALLVPALAFGTLLQSFLLFTRDTSAYVTILQPPLAFFGGVRVPVAFMPGWMQAVAAVLPLTWSLRVARGLLTESASVASVSRSLGVLALMSIACFVVAALIADRAERAAKRSGSLVLY